MDTKHNQTITFNALHHCMMRDPYYGVETSATESIINNLYEGSADNALYRQFANQFSLLPCKKDHQRHLVYLWCGVMGLPSYRNGTALNWGWKGFLNNWTQDFDIRLSELQDFLRQHSWPLPVAFFPDDVDNTEKKVALDDAEFSRAFDDFVIQLPQLEEELAELQKIQPESMQARHHKKREIEEIEQKIRDIYSGDINGKKGTLAQNEKANSTHGLEKGSPEWRSRNAQMAANARHDKPGGSRDKQQRIREIWATGKYTSRDICAEQECAELGMSFSTARKALINTPDPAPSTQPLPSKG